MAHKKAGGSTSNGRDSNPKMRGVKLYAGESARSGNILIRQKGSVCMSGPNTAYGRDFTIYATCDGLVRFGQKRVMKFNGQRQPKTFVEIVPVVA